MRNQESIFALNPQVNIQRSKFDRSSNVLTSFNVGEIIPFYCDEVLPGDTFDIETFKVVRTSTLIAPIMGDINVDTYFFFVPNRLVWTHWPNLMGENTESAWVPTTQYQVPSLTAPSSTGWTALSLADYFGIPTGIPDLEVNALPFRAYAKIMNDWFRDENLCDPLYFDDGDTDHTGSNGSDYVNDVYLGGSPYKAAKYHDYFTSALPGPLKNGQDVELPLGTQAPVYTGSTDWDFSKFPKAGSPAMAETLHFKKIDDGTNSYGPLANTEYGTLTNGGSVSGYSVGLYPSNLYADLSVATASTINQLRQAFAIQKYFEKSARQGSRYIEMIEGFFGVRSSDARLQRSEYLGGNRRRLNINQVVQSSATQSQSGLTTTPQGTVTAYSLTTDKNSDFTRSFQEHGFVIGVMVARYNHLYQQGLEKFWKRFDKFDYYLPVFANLGEVGIKNVEIYAQGPSVLNPDTGKAYDDEIFGYQECWADYRYKPSHTCGMFRSTYATSLDMWHLGDEYSSLPTLSDDWIYEDKSNVDRVLAVTSSVSNQILADVTIRAYVTRPMPVRSIPGLIDHH